jgi:hypothetical protein
MVERLVDGKLVSEQVDRELEKCGVVVEGDAHEALMVTVLEAAEKNIDVPLEPFVEAMVEEWLNLN